MLDEKLIGGSSKDIPISQAYLLMKAPCSQLQALQPGCRDLTGICLPASLIEFCKTTVNANFSENDVRMVPETALAKLLTFQWTETDALG